MQLQQIEICRESKVMNQDLSWSEREELFIPYDEFHEEVRYDSNRQLHSIQVYSSSYEW